MKVTESQDGIHRASLAITFRCGLGDFAAAIADMLESDRLLDKPNYVPTDLDYELALTRIRSKAKVEETLRVILEDRGQAGIESAGSKLDQETYDLCMKRAREMFPELARERAKAAV